MRTRTNHFDTSSAAIFVNDLSSLIIAELDDIITATPDSINFDSVVSAIAFLDQNSPGKHLDLRREAGIIDLYLESCLVLENMLKCDEWLNLWGQNRHNKERVIRKLYKSIHRKWDKKNK